MLGKVSDASDIGFNGVWRIVADLQVFGHFLTQSRHFSISVRRHGKFLSLNVNC
jgi:hypothetical protein